MDKANHSEKNQLLEALEKVGQELFISAYRAHLSDKAISAAEYLNEKGVFNAD